MSIAAPSAAAADFTWNGGAAAGSAASANWSNAGNWAGGTSPSGSVGTLSFPALTSPACTATPPTATCYTSHNDQSGVSANALSIDDGASYFIDGNGLTIGAGGLTATTTSMNFGVGSTLTLPIGLGADQTWSIDGGSNLTGSGLNLQSPLAASSHTLGVALSHGGELDLSGDSEVGAVTISGADTSQTGSSASNNGLVSMIGKLNGTDGDAVNVADALLAAGSATVGPLTAAGAQIQVGNGTNPPGILSVDGAATLDSASQLIVTVQHSGAVAGTDYGQLSATGNVNLGGAALAVVLGRGASCPTLSVGDVYTLVSTSGALTGTFAGIPDGSTITTERCSPQYSLRINYTTTAVTATVLSSSTGGVPGQQSPPTISGTPTQGQTLTESNGTWTNNPGSYTYQWEDCDSAGNNCSGIAQATNQTYTLTNNDAGDTIRVLETAHNAAGASDAIPSDPTAVVTPLPPDSLSPPTIHGTPASGQTLTELHGTWTNRPSDYAYQWKACDDQGNNCSDILNATSQTYTLTYHEAGHTIRVFETASNAGGKSAAVGSDPTAQVTAPPPPVNQSRPTISGPTTDGQTLTESHGVWTPTPTSYTYQWQDCDGAGHNCSDIPNATAQSYALTSSDACHTVRVTETAIDDGGPSQNPATSDATAVVQGLHPDYTWTGTTVPYLWSNPANWAGCVPPAGTVDTLTFPSPSPCPTNNCAANSDVSGLTVSKINLADGAAAGGNEPLTLTSGLGETGAAGLTMPITLGAPNTWTIDALRVGSVSGPTEPLAINLSRGISLGETEVGPLSITGSDSHPDSDCLNFCAGVGASGSLNGGDGQPVTLTHVRLSGVRDIGPLSAKSLTWISPLNSSNGPLKVEGDLNLEPGTGFDVQIGNPNGTSGITATGKASLDGARLLLSARSCTAWTTYTLVEAQGGISGALRDYGTGSPIYNHTMLDVGCPQKVQISYTPTTITALVLGPPGSAPAVQTGPTSSISDTAATVSGSVNPGGVLINDCEFRYDDGDNFASAPCSPAPGAGKSAVPVSANLSGLIPGTTYSYHLTATNWYGQPNSGDSLSFTTTGSSAPTVVTDPATWDGSTRKAVLQGSVNPHNDDALVTFYYGTSPVAVSSGSDLRRYGNASNVTQYSTGGTTDVPETFQLDDLSYPLKYNTKYYFRLAASNSKGVAWGDEQVLYTGAPDPVNVLKPYLQASSDYPDADHGYDLHCVPGTWQNANGNFAMHWVDVGPTLTQAPGATRTDVYTNDVYHVSKIDRGHVVACAVVPYGLDGNLSSVSVLSNGIIVVGTSHIELPAWMKSAIENKDATDVVQNAVETIDTCVEFATLGMPEMCIYEGFGYVFSTWFQNTLEDRFLDPADPAYQAIALPTHPLRLHLPAARRTPCAHRPARACARLRATLRQLGFASRELQAITTALVTQHNRLAIAVAHGDSKTQLAQLAAVKVYMGELASALQAEHQIASRLANQLVALHLNLHASRATLLRLDRQPAVKALKRSLDRQLIAGGFNAAELRHVTAGLRKRARSFNLARTLRATLPTETMLRFYNTISFADLAALINALEGQHALRAGAQTRLLADLDHARAACSPPARGAAIQTLLGDAEPGSNPAYFGFLKLAAQPLVNGSSGTDPYPAC